MYKIIILQTGSFDSNKSVIERRYSDFEKLHRNLLEEFSEELEDVTFPKKTLTGNFTEEIINERKLAFKDYLRLLYSMKYIRRSKKFIDFLTRPELQEAYGCLRGGQYTKALEILVEVIGLQERLTRGNPVATVPTLCAIVVCHKDLENPASAFEYGEKALARLGVRTSHRYYMPLLETMITLAYELGKDFLSLQEKLEEWKTKKDPIRVFTLKELAVREYVRWAQEKFNESADSWKSENWKLPVWLTYNIVLIGKKLNISCAQRDINIYVGIYYNYCTDMWSSWGGL